MSVTAMGRVWERSRAKGSELLVLLAIADYAGDDGRDAWPSVQTLAEKSRMTDRGIRDVLRRLVEMGELAIERNGGGREVSGGYRPKSFLHVLCCAQNGKDFRNPEKISGPDTGKDFRNSEKISEKRHGDVPKTAPERTRIKEDPSGDPREISPRARDPRRPHPLDEPLESPVVLPAASLQAFDELYALYPNKDRKVAAWTAWHALNPTPEQAQFIVTHVRMRLAAGWMRDTAPRFVPLLCTFIEEKRWLDHVRPDQTEPARNGCQPDGTLTARTCPMCREYQEGKFVNGAPVFPPCAKCASQAGGASP